MALCDCKPCEVHTGCMDRRTVCGKCGNCTRYDHHAPGCPGCAETIPYNVWVICRGDRKPDGTPGEYALATCWPFASYAAAADYASGVSESREPKILVEVG